MSDFLTGLCILGAAASLALCLALKHARRLALVSEYVSRIPRPRLAAFLAFALVATLCAQKQGGTNAPPQGASPQQGGNVELHDLPVRGVDDMANLCFTSISVSTNSAVLSLAWPASRTPRRSSGICIS